MPERYKGKVKWFNAEKGYGFIVPDAGGADVFVHIRDIEASGLSGLENGQAVEYAIEIGKRGSSKPRACALTAL